ncbi:MAG TPA: lysylphosphatidylglycerol synthase transmembrane domain-containing protein, partial [Bryobacteraceae bacterium]|nr:lysylphosphatidylglycerol synthase transmembrane domain-containing protein [Bryobacteraceae bacterium]
GKTKAALRVCDTGLFDELSVAIGNAAMQLRAGSIPQRNLSRWWLAVSIPLAAALLYWSARGVAWRQVWETMARARVAYLWGAAAITSSSLFLRAVRWRILLNAEARLGVGTVFRANMCGYLGNNFLPARAGEVLRSVLISRASDLSNTYVLTTALSERMMDVVAVVLAAALALLTVNPKPAWLTSFSRGMMAAAAAGALAVAILPHTGTLIDRVLERLPLPRRICVFLRSTAGQVLLGLRAFHHWGRLAEFAALTAVVWSADGLSIVVGARALHLAIPFPAAILLLTAMALGSALPSTPGYIGIYQFAAVMVLPPFGISRDKALAYSVIAQAVSYAVVAALGLPALYASRVRPEKDAARSRSAAGAVG